MSDSVKQWQVITVTTVSYDEQRNKTSALKVYDTGEENGDKPKFLETYDYEGMDFLSRHPIPVNSDSSVKREPGVMHNDIYQLSLIPITHDGVMIALLYMKTSTGHVNMFWSQQLDSTKTVSAMSENIQQSLRGQSDLLIETLQELAALPSDQNKTCLEKLFRLMEGHDLPEPPINSVLMALFDESGKDRPKEEPVKLSDFANGGLAGLAERIFGGRRNRAQQVMQFTT